MTRALNFFFNLADLHKADATPVAAAPTRVTRQEIDQLFANELGRNRG